MWWRWSIFGHSCSWVAKLGWCFVAIARRPLSTWWASVRVCDVTCDRQVTQYNFECPHSHAFWMDSMQNPCGIHAESMQNPWNLYRIQVMSFRGISLYSMEIAWNPGGIHMDSLYIFGSGLGVLKHPPECLESTWIPHRFRAECVGEGKELNSIHPCTHSMARNGGRSQKYYYNPAGVAYNAEVTVGRLNGFSPTHTQAATRTVLHHGRHNDGLEGAAQACIVGLHPMFLAFIMWLVWWIIPMQGKS